MDIPRGKEIIDAVRESYRNRDALENICRNYTPAEIAEAEAKDYLSLMNR
jgi:hypothetical protein